MDRVLVFIKGTTKLILAGVLFVIVLAALIGALWGVAVYYGLNLKTLSSKEWQAVYSGVTAFATLTYMAATFSLWWATRKSISAMSDAFTLNFVLGHHQIYVAPKEIQGWSLYYQNLLKKAFPQEYEKLLPRS